MGRSFVAECDRARQIGSICIFPGRPGSTTTNRGHRIGSKFSSAAPMKTENQESDGVWGLCDRGGRLAGGGRPLWKMHIDPICLNRRAGQLTEPRTTPSDRAPRKAFARKLDRNVDYAFLSWAAEPFQASFERPTSSDDRVFRDFKPYARPTTTREPSKLPKNVPPGGSKNA